MYRPRGFLAGGSELGDVEVVASGERLHLFHLTLPNHDLVAHLVSEDGLAWEPRPPALRTGDPGAPDDDMIWTVGVAEAPQDGQWHMLYTALSRAEDGRVQRAALATSPDLETWTKAGGVAFEADSRWYQTAPDGWPWVSWRDPKPLRTDEGWLAVVCARGLEGPPTRRGVVGLARSDDLRRWTVEPPLLDPRQSFDVECPQLFRVGERWYLTAAHLDDRSQRYWIADHPRGPFRTAPDDRLAPQGHYAARIVSWRGRAAMFCWHDAADAAPGRTARRALASPLVLEPRSDGTLRAAPWPEWDRYAEGEPRSLTPDATGAFGHPSARAQIGDGTLDGRVEAGAEAWPLARPDAGYRIEAELELSAARGGLVCGLADGQGVLVQIDPAAHRLRLVAQRPGQRDDGRGPVAWLDREVLQEAPLRWDGAARLAVRLVDDEIEVAVGGRVLLSTLARDARGPIAAFVEGGRIALRDATIQPLRSPTG